MCINKADYLSKELIAHWNKYFKDKKVTHIFFSAKMEQNKLDEQSDDEESSSEDEDLKVEEEKEFEPMFDDLKKEIETNDEEKKVNKVPEGEQDQDLDFNTDQIYSRE